MVWSRSWYDRGQPLPLWFCRNFAAFADSYGANSALVASFLIRFFQVVEYFPPESDDEYGDLWLIKYEDGDSEHFNEEEVMTIAAAATLYCSSISRLVCMIV